MRGRRSRVGGPRTVGEGRGQKPTQRRLWKGQRLCLGPFVPSRDSRSLSPLVPSCSPHEQGGKLVLILTHV